MSDSQRTHYKNVFGESIDDMVEQIFKEARACAKVNMRNRRNRNIPEYEDWADYGYFKLRVGYMDNSYGSFIEKLTEILDV